VTPGNGSDPSWSTIRGRNHGLAGTGCRRNIPVLADADDVRDEAYTGVDMVRGGRWLPELVEAFRMGNAPPPLSWEPEGREEANRTLFLNLLGTEWLPWKVLALRDPSCTWWLLERRARAPSRSWSISDKRVPLLDAFAYR
jgi:hypothetical protein